VPEVIEPGVAVGAANSAMPMSPTAPGTSIQTAGRKVASCGGPDGHVATHAATLPRAGSKPDAERHI